MPARYIGECCLEYGDFMKRHYLKKLLNVLLNLGIVLACLAMFGGMLLFGMYAPLPPNETMPPYMAASTPESVQQQVVTGDSFLQPICTWLGITLSEDTP